MVINIFRILVYVLLYWDLLNSRYGCIVIGGGYFRYGICFRGFFYLWEFLDVRKGV